MPLKNRTSIFDKYNLYSYFEICLIYGEVKYTTNRILTETVCIYLFDEQIWQKQQSAFL